MRKIGLICIIFVIVELLVTPVIAESFEAPKYYPGGGVEITVTKISLDDITQNVDLSAQHLSNELKIDDVKDIQWHITQMHNTRQFGTINYLSPVSLSDSWKMEINSGQLKGQSLNPAIFYQNKDGKYVLLEQATLQPDNKTVNFSRLSKEKSLEILNNFSSDTSDTSNPKINTYKLFIGYILKENNKESVYIQSSMQIGQYKLAPFEPTFDGQNNLIGKAFQKGDKITIKVGDKEVSSTDSAKEDGSWRIDNLPVNSPYTITESNDWGDVSIPISMPKTTNNQNKAQQNQAFRITKIDPIDFGTVDLTSYPTIARDIHIWGLEVSRQGPYSSWAISAQVGEQSPGMNMFYIDHQYKWRCLNTSQKIFSNSDDQSTTHVKELGNNKFRIEISSGIIREKTPGFGVHIDTGTIGLGPKKATINLTLASTP